MPQFKYHNGTDWVILGEENQNAFSQIQVGAFQIQADAKNDVLPFSGENGIDVFSDGNGLVISITGGVYEPKVINGTNTNGLYYKFDNSLLICSQTVNVTFNVGDILKMIDWTFPQTFKPLTIPSIVQMASNAGTINPATGYGSVTNTIQNDVQFALQSQATTRKLITYNMIQIGQWK